jgi:hypothetical protein
MLADVYKLEEAMTIERKWEYKVKANPLLPPGAKSPVMASEDYEHWLNSMDEQGWEFVSYMQKLWNDDTTTQQFWVFRRPFGS